MTLWLHVFHPAFHSRDWTTENYSVVLDNPDRAAGMKMARDSGTFHGNTRLAHAVFELIPGMTLQACGYDHCTLAVNGEIPPEA